MFHLLPLLAYHLDWGHQARSSANDHAVMQLARATRRAGKFVDQQMKILSCHVFLLFSSSLTTKRWHALQLLGHLRLLCEKSKNNCVRSLVFKFFREEDAHKTYRWNSHWFITLGPLQLCQNHQRIMSDYFDSKIFPEEDGASELTIETSRRNLHVLILHVLFTGNISNTNNPMKILREFFLFWILNQAQMVQKTYNWNIPMACWWNQLLCGATGRGYRAVRTFSTGDIRRSRWEHYTGCSSNRWHYFNLP